MDYSILVRARKVWGYLENIVKLASIRSGIKTQESEDEMVRESVREIESRLIKYADSMGIKWSPTLDEVEKARKKSHRQEKERWMQLTSQGQGVSWFARDKIGNT